MSQAQFDKAVIIVREINEDKAFIELDRDEKLAFYKFFKQATEGDNTSAEPGPQEYVEKAKWDAWNEAKGTSKEDAKSKYVEHFFVTLKKHDHESAKKYISEVEALA